MVRLDVKVDCVLCMVCVLELTLGFLFKNIEVIKFELTHPHI